MAPLNFATVLFSGGIDSLACLEWARQRFGSVTALYVNLDVSYSKYELGVCRSMVFGSNVRTEYIEFPELGKHEDALGHVPFRNIFFLEMAAMYSDNVVFVMLRGEYSEDKSPAFVKRMQSLFDSQTAANLYNSGERKIIHVPFAKKTKTQVVAWLLQQGYTRNDLRQTIGCLQGRACGQCMSCLNRWIAFENNGLGNLDQFEGTMTPARWGLDMLQQRKQGITSQAFKEVSWWKKRHWILDAHRAYTSAVRRGLVSVTPFQVLFP